MFSLQMKWGREREREKIKFRMDKDKESLETLHVWLIELRTFQFDHFNAWTYKNVLKLGR